MKKIVVFRPPQVSVLDQLQSFKRDHRTVSFGRLGSASVGPRAAVPTAERRGRRGRGQAVLE